MPGATILADLSSRPAAQTAQAAALLDKTLSGQEPPAVVNMVLGTRELHQGNLEQALALLERANASNPRMPIVMNNLAWALANQDPPELERAVARRPGNCPITPKSRTPWARSWPVWASTKRP